MIPTKGIVLSWDKRTGKQTLHGGLCEDNKATNKTLQPVLHCDLVVLQLPSSFIVTLYQANEAARNAPFRRTIIIELPSGMARPRYKSSD
jgi:hypothetical protein